MWGGVRCGRVVHRRASVWIRFCLPTSHVWLCDLIRQSSHLECSLTNRFECDASIEKLSTKCIKHMLALDTWSADDVFVMWEVFFFFFFKLQACMWVKNSRGLEMTHELAAQHAKKAVDAILELPHTSLESATKCRQALIDITEKVLRRTKWEGGGRQKGVLKICWFFREFRRNGSQNVSCVTKVVANGKLGFHVSHVV